MRTCESALRPRIVVPVRKDMAGLVSDFLHRRDDELGTMPAAIHAGDFRSLRIWGHNLAGTGAAYGFKAITDIGRCLEEAAKAADTERIQKLSSQLADFLNDLEVIYV